MRDLIGFVLVVHMSCQCFSHFFFTNHSPSATLQNKSTTLIYPSGYSIQEICQIKLQINILATDYYGFFAMPGLEPSASHMLDKHFITELYPQHLKSFCNQGILKHVPVYPVNTLTSSKNSQGMFNNYYCQNLKTYSIWVMWLLLSIFVISNYRYNSV